MKIVSTITYRSLEAQFGGFDATEHEIQTTNARLLVTRYDDSDRWFVNYIDLSDWHDTLRIIDHMDRNTWRKVWAEFRQFQNRR